MKDKRTRLDIARHGEVHERWHLTGEEDLDEETFEVLGADPQEHVRAALLSNHSTPAHIVASLAAAGGQFADSARSHPNASSERLGSAPLNQQTSAAFDSYLDKQGATPAERHHLFAIIEEAYEKHWHNMTLAEAWATVKGM